jgi:enoyl-ACP reductase-like protein
LEHEVRYGFAGLARGRPKQQRPTRNTLEERHACTRTPSEKRECSRERSPSSPGPPAASGSASRGLLTPLVQKQIDDIAARERISGEAARARLLGEKQPSLEFATPEQIGALVAFLCSDAAAQIRGVALPVDGGWTAQ